MKPCRLDTGAWPEKRVEGVPSPCKRKVYRVAFMSKLCVVMFMLKADVNATVAFNAMVHPVP